MALTKEERSAISRANLAKARDAKRIKTAKTAPEQEAATVANPEEEVQCIYCSLEFRRKNLDEHQQALHRGEMLQQEQVLPAAAASLSPGSTVRSPSVNGQPGIPMKVPWSIKWITDGFECENPGDRDPARGGWRKIPEDDEVPTCDVCGKPMRKMFQIVHWDAPSESPDFVQWNGVSCKVFPGRENILPDIFVSILRESIKSRTGVDATAPRQASDLGKVPFTKLAMTGFIRDEDTALEPEAEVPAVKG